MDMFKKNEEDSESHIIDSTIIRVHQHASGARRIHGSQAIGKSRGGRTTKIHWIVDALGLPVDFMLTGGQVDDSKMFIPLLENKKSKYVLGDKAYDTNANRDLLERTKREAVIPSSRKRSEVFDYDKHIYKERTLIECHIGRTKQSRRLATRYEKTDIMYRGMVVLSCILVWLF
jgi:transposase